MEKYSRAKKQSYVTIFFAFLLILLSTTTGSMADHLPERPPLATGSPPVQPDQASNSAATQHVNLVLDNVHIDALSRRRGRLKPPVVQPPPPAASCKSQSLQIASGDVLSTAMQPENALTACRAALELSCDEASKRAALACIEGAIAERVALNSINAQLHVMDESLAGGHIYRAKKQAATLMAWYQFKDAKPRRSWRSLQSWFFPDYKGDLPCIDEVCRRRQAVLLQMLNDEIGKRSRSMLVPAVLLILRYALLGLALLLLALALLSLIRFLSKRYRTATQPVLNQWIVWSIVDDGKSGSAGAVMEALNPEVNPLISPYLREGNSGRLAKARRQFLLAPPFGSGTTQNQRVSRTSVWADFLGAGPEDHLFIERLPFQAGSTFPTFKLTEAYDDVDLTVGSLKIAGVSRIARMWTRAIRKNWPSVTGFVHEFTDDKKLSRWTVRLNCLQPGPNSSDEQTASVVAESIATEYGDTLGLVAQRAAFKLVMRILSPPIAKPSDNSPEDLTTNEITAIAAYRQGLQQLMQLL